MNKLNRILAAILILQLIAVTVVLWPRRTPSAAEGTPLFSGIEVEHIVGLTIASADSQSIQLAKRNGDWVLPTVDDYPCLEDKVPNLLTKILGLKGSRLVAQTSSSHKRLRVASNDFERRVEFELDDGTRHLLYLGTSPSFRAIHVRADDQNQVYLVSDLTLQDAGARASDWINREYFSIPTDQIIALMLENQNGRFEFEKEGDIWTMKGLSAGETLDQDRFKTLVNRAALITLTEPLGKTEKETYGLQQPSAVITLRTHSNETGDRTYVLMVGAKDTTDNSYIVKSSESQYYVRVSEFTVKEFVEKTREGFLQLPPTPTPTPEASPEATPQS